jgi:hypothetical protein
MTRLTEEALSSAWRIDSSTQAIAEEQAQQTGMTPYEWLDQRLAEDAEWFEGDRETPAGLSAATDEATPLAAVARYDEAFDVVWVQPAPDDVAEAPPSAEGDALPQDEGPGDWIGPFLAGMTAQLNAIGDELAGRIAEGAASRLDGIERALQPMRGDIDAEQDADVATWPMAQGAARAAYRGPRALDPAVKQLGLEVARIAEVAHARFERLDLTAAEQAAALRAELRQVIDGLAARIAACERRDAPAAGEPDTWDSTSTASSGLVFGPPPAPAGPADVVFFNPFDFTPLVAAGLDDSMTVPEEALAEPETVAVPAEAMGPVAARDRGRSRRRGKGLIFRRRAPRPDGPPRTRASGLTTAVMVVGGGAGLGAAAAALLLVATGSVGAPPDSHVVSVNATPAKAMHLRTRQAPVEVMTVTVSPPRHGSEGGGRDPQQQ